MLLCLSYCAFALRSCSLSETKMRVTEVVAHRCVSAGYRTELSPVYGGKRKTILNGATLSQNNILYPQLNQNCGRVLSATTFDSITKFILCFWEA